VAGDNLSHEVQAAVSFGQLLGGLLKRRWLLRKKCIGIIGNNINFWFLPKGKPLKEGSLEARKYRKHGRGQPGSS
jgi:hypothetical protein